MGLSLKEAARRSGLTDTIIYRIERDEIAEPSASAVSALCKLYGLPVVDVYKRLGWLSEEDLASYALCFPQADKLDLLEKQHVQSEIDFLLRRKDGTKNDL